MKDMLSQSTVQYIHLNDKLKKMGAFPPTRRRGVTLMLMLLGTAVPELLLDSPRWGGLLGGRRLVSYLTLVLLLLCTAVPALLLDSPRWGGLLGGEGW